MDLQPNYSRRFFSHEIILLPLDLLSWRDRIFQFKILMESVPNHPPIRTVVIQSKYCQRIYNANPELWKSAPDMIRKKYITCKDTILDCTIIISYQYEVYKVKLFVKYHMISTPCDSNKKFSFSFNEFCQCRNHWRVCSDANL